jgi:hypothetical protein
MADTAQLESALVKADAAGDAEGAKILADAIRKARAVQPIKLGAEALPEQVKKESEGRPLWEQFLGGVGGEVKNADQRAKQILSLLPVSQLYKLMSGQKLGMTPLSQQEQTDVAANRGLQETPAGMAGGIAGDLALTAIPGAQATKALSGPAAKVVPQFVAPTTAAAVTGAALSTATKPVLPGESEVMNTALGAAGAGVGDVAGRGVSRVIQPIRQSDAVKTLVKEGIIPTPGQAAGPQSFIGRFEQRLESLPLLGDIITRGRTRSIEELNRAAVNGSLPNGEKISAVGRKAIDEANTIFDNAYRGALSGKEVPMTAGKINSAVQSVKNDPDVFLTKEAEANLDKLAQQLLSRMPSGKTIMTGEAAKSADSWLGGIAARYNKSPNAADRELGSAVLGLQKAFRSDLSAAIPELRGIDAKYASFLRVLRAAGATGSKDGIFSPEALQSSVRSMDKSRSGFASGNALMQNLSDPAVNVLGRSVADSGTAGRALVGAGLLGAGGAANEFYGGPGYLTSLALAPALYSRAGSRYLIGDYAGQKSLAELARRTAPYAAQVGRAVAGQKSLAELARRTAPYAAQVGRAVAD